MCKEYGGLGSKFCDIKLLERLTQLRPHVASVLPEEKGPSTPLKYLQICHCLIIEFVRKCKPIHEVTSSCFGLRPTGFANGVRNQREKNSYQSSLCWGFTQE